MRRMVSITEQSRTAVHILYNMMKLEKESMIHVPKSDKHINKLPRDRKSLKKLCK